MKNKRKFHWKQIQPRQWLHRKWFWFTLISAISLIAALICMSCFRHAGTVLRDQNVAQEWAGTSETEYAEVSVFFQTGSTVDRTAIQTFRDKLTTNLSELVTEDLAHLYCDGWSTKGKLTVEGMNGKSDASVMAVGGNFFQLHPLDLVSGGYFSDDDLMHDRVILDEELAWRLFGGYNLTGMTVTINGMSFQVAGVINRPTDKASQTAYADGAGLYMSYDTYQTLNENAAISSYEILMPNPVDGYAKQQVTDNLAPKDAVVVENSSRFTAGRIFSLLRHLNQRTMRTDTVTYPSWENAARIVENRCMIFMVLAILFWICPVVFVVILAVKVYRKMKGRLRETYLDLKDQYENRVLWSNLQAKWKGRKHGRSDAETHQEDL